MTLNIFELDDKGIRPRISESEEKFIENGNLMLRAAKKISDSELIDGAKGNWERVEYEYKDYEIKSFCGNEKIKQEALEYVKVKYGSDLSWVRFLSMRPPALIPFDKYLRGCVTPVLFKIEGVEIQLPVVLIYSSHKETFVHELIHTARISRTWYNFKEYPARDGFEEDAADDQYFRSSSLSYGRTKKFYKIKRKLQKYFGGKHGYVFTRLTYTELMENILSDITFSNPVSFLKTMAFSNKKLGDSSYKYKNLKYKILCEKLGL